MTQPTQRERLTQALRKGWHTWADLQEYRISTCPHVRLICEGGLGRSMVEGEMLERRERADGLVEMRVVRR
ncbi:MAG: hypothetical protein RJA55_1440 [Acidobacteriota bacterium]